MSRALALALALVAVPALAGAESPKPLLWKVSDADTTVYLLGTFHLLTPEDYPLDARVDAALADAEHVVLELAPAELQGPELARTMAAAGQRGANDLQRELPAPLRAELERRGAAIGLPGPAIGILDPWYLGLVLTMAEMGRLGLDPSLGLDKHLASKAGERGLPTEGLETGAEQIALFEGMAWDVQVDLLADSLRPGSEIAAEVRELHALWRAGDADRLYDGMAAEMRQRYPALYARINTERNARWLPRVRAMLDGRGDEDALVAVGSLHLLGEEGLVEGLREAGYSVERL